MTIKTLTDYLESIAPLALQEDYDNSGLLVGDHGAEIKSALVCLDVTPDIIAEAREKGCGLVIGHHPLIFRGLKRLTGDNHVQRAVMDAIRHGIAIYAIHTNLDNVLQDGVNGKIADRLGLEGRKVLAPKEMEGPEGIGAGVVGRLARPMPEAEFLAYLKERMELKVFRHTKLLGKEVQTVAVCGGSGAFLLPAAKAAGAQCYVSADFKYHDFFEAEENIFIADIGHFESERFTIELIGELIRRKFPNFAAQLTSTVTNPISYYPS